MYFNGTKKPNKLAYTIPLTVIKGKAAAFGICIPLLTTQSNYLLKNAAKKLMCMDVHCMTLGTKCTGLRVLYLAAWQVQPVEMKD